MSLWWLQPGWTSARCGNCGVNIYAAGGDPDHGLCPECWEESHRQAHPEPQPMPRCDVCKRGEACADVNGMAVCSAECAAIAQSAVSQEGKGNG